MANYKDKGLRPKMTKAEAGRLGAAAKNKKYTYEDKAAWGKMGGHRKGVLFAIARQAAAQRGLNTRTVPKPL